MKRNYFFYLVIFSAGFSLAQLTRTTDYEHAIGFAVRAFCESIGWGVVLFALGLGAMTAYHILMEGADRFALESVMKRLKSEARS